MAVKMMMTVCLYNIKNQCLLESTVVDKQLTNYIYQGGVNNLRFCGVVLETDAYLESFRNFFGFVYYLSGSYPRFVFSLLGTSLDEIRKVWKNWSFLEALREAGKEDSNEKK